MGANRIFQFENCLLPIYCGAAQENLRFDTHILHLANTDNFLNVNPQELMGFLYPQPQGPNLPTSAAYRYYIHRTHILLQTHHLLFYLL